jgi:hypothetical protein
MSYIDPSGLCPTCYAGGAVGTAILPGVGTAIGVGIGAAIAVVGTGVR